MKTKSPHKKNTCKPPRCQHQAGFTMLEVLMAVTVFAIGLLGIAQIQLSTIRGNAHAKRLTRAAVLASDQAEALMATPYDSIEDGSITYDNGDILLNWNVTANTAAGYKDIVITCSPAAGKSGSTVKIKLKLANMP